MGRSLAAAFTTEKNRNWARPVMSSVFHFGGSVGDIYISDRDITIGGNAHKGCSYEWGEWQSLINPREGTFQVVTMPIKMLNYPIFGSPAKRFTDLWSGIGIEGVECDVYQNFRQVGTSAILQELLFSGVCRPGPYSPYECQMEIISVSQKYLEKAEVSWVLTQADWPLADPDDIGKRANLPYGSLKNVRCHWVKAGLQSPLQELMSAGTGYVRIAQDFYDLLPAVGTVQIGDEQIVYASKTTIPNPRLVSLTRQANGTPLQSHAVNDNIVQVLTEYWALASGYEAKAISNVKIWRNGLGYPLTGYTIELANTTAKPGKTVALIKIPTPPTIKELPVVTLSNNLFLNDGIAVNDGSGVNDGAGIADTISVIDNVGVSKAGTVTENIGLSQPNTEGKWAQAGSDQTLSFSTAISNGSFQDLTISFPAQEKTKSSGSFARKVSFLFPPTNNNTEWYIVDGADTVLLQDSTGARAAMPVQRTTTVFWNLVLRRKGIGVGRSDTVTVNISSKTIDYNIDQTVSKIGTVADGISVAKIGTASKGGAAAKTGSVTKTGAVTKSGSVSLAGDVTISSVSTAEVVLGEFVTCDIDGVPDDGAGTYTGTAAALIEKPADVIHHLPRAISGIPVGRIDTTALVTARNDSPASYKFACNFGERSNLKELLIALGMQSRLRVDWPVDKLTARFLKSTYPAASKTLTQENIMRDGRRSTLKIQRSSPDDLINIVNLYFGHDWTVAKSRTSFAKVYSVSDSASITKYLSREHLDRFLFDFIAPSNEAMAADLGDYYLSLYKEPKRIINFDAKLDQYELLPGDVVALSFLASQFASGDLFGPGVPTITFDVSTFASGKVSENFDALTGANKFLIEEVRHRPGAARDGRSTRIGLVLREVS